MATVQGKAEEGVTGAEKEELLEGDRGQGAAPGPEFVRAAAIATIEKLAEAHGLKIILVEDRRLLEQIMNTLMIGTHLNSDLIDKALKEYCKNHPV